jgi:hypothetical protein
MSNEQRKILLKTDTKTITLELGREVRLHHTLISQADEPLTAGYSCVLCHFIRHIGFHRCSQVRQPVRRWDVRGLPEITAYGALDMRPA